MASDSETVTSKITVNVRSGTRNQMGDGSSIAGSLDAFKIS